MIKNMKINNLKKYYMMVLLVYPMLLNAQVDSLTMIENLAKSIGSNQNVSWLLMLTAVALGIVAIILGLLVGKVAIFKIKAKKSISIMGAIVVAGALQAQSSQSDMHWHLSSEALNLILLSIIFIELLIILYFAYWLKVIVLPTKQKAIKPKTNAWWDWFNKSVSFEKEKDVQLDHNYDGIKELDNALPPWWLYGFYITIIFSGIYLWRYHISCTAPLSYEELQNDLRKSEIELNAALAKKGDRVDENSIEYKEDAIMIEEGRSIFESNCKACHADNAGGMPNSGPNLTDKYWIHGGDIKNVFKTIRYGVVEKGMIAWSNVLSNKQIAQVATYIKSIKEPVVGGQPPKGDLFDDAGAKRADTIVR
jgi:cytochrome c oxidase cbb3-type subunit 3